MHAIGDILHCCMCVCSRLSNLLMQIIETYFCLRHEPNPG